MVVENAGFGAANAAPIARRVFDYWLMGLYPSEEDMAAVRKGQATTPIGKPRSAAEAAWPPGGAGAAMPAASAASAAIAAKAASAAPVAAVSASATIRTASP
jgi:penicillin-binding protein 2